jgi:hypothetical protein
MNDIVWNITMNNHNEQWTILCEISQWTITMNNERYCVKYHNEQSQWTMNDIVWNITMNNHNEQWTILCVLQDYWGFWCRMWMSVAGVGALKSALEKVQDYPVCNHSAEALWAPELRSTIYDWCDQKTEFCDCVPATKAHEPEALSSMIGTQEVSIYTVDHNLTTNCRLYSWDSSLLEE